MSGDLFVIHCTTCSTRLRVREAGVIGQILACPKCGSMVLVQPPPDFKLEGAPAVAAAEVISVRPTASAKGPGASLTRETVSDSDFADVSALFDEPTKPAPTNNNSNAPAVPAAIAKPPVKQPPAAQPSASPKPAAPVVAKPIEPQPAIARQIAETGDFERPSAKPIPEKLTSTKTAAEKIAKQQLANQKPATQPALAPPPPAELSAPLPKAKAIAQPTVGTQTAATAAASAEAPLPVPEVIPPHVKRWRFVALLIVTCTMGIALTIGVAYLAAGRRPTVEKQTEITQLPTQPEVPPETSSESTEPKSVEKISEKMEEPKTDEPLPIKEKIEVTFPPVDPPPMPKPDLLIDPPIQEKGSDPLKLDELRKFERLLNNSTETTEPITSESTAKKPLPLVPEVVALPRPEMRKIDITARLADKLPKIEFEACPLVDFLQVISNFSTIPITLDPQALPWSRITPAHPIKTSLTNLSVRDVLKEALAPYRLEPVVVGETVVITRSSVPKNIPYPIADLTKNDAKQTASLAEFVEALAAPESWTSTGGTGTIKPQGETLAINTTELAHTQVMELLERLRVARGMEPKSKLPRELFVMERRTQRAAAALTHPLTLNFSQPTPLVKILKRLGSETGVQILVDWHALAEAGWPTDSEASVTLEKNTLADSLRKLLDPMDLTYRVIDAKTLQITSYAALPKLRELEIYRVSTLLAADEEEPKLMERLQAHLGEGVVIRYDAPSQCLFVLASQSQHELLSKSVKGEE